MRLSKYINDFRSYTVKLTDKKNENSDKVKKSY